LSDCLSDEDSDIIEQLIGQGKVRTAYAFFEKKYRPAEKKFTQGTSFICKTPTELEEVFVNFFRSDKL
jgi:hypothetical protein